MNKIADKRGEEFLKITIVRMEHGDTIGRNTQFENKIESQPLFACLL